MYPWFVNPACGQLSKENEEKKSCPRSPLRIWSSEIGSAVPSGVSLLILHTRFVPGLYWLYIVQYSLQQSWRKGTSVSKVRIAVRASYGRLTGKLIVAQVQLFQLPEFGQLNGDCAFVAANRRAAV